MNILRRVFGLDPKPIKEQKEVNSAIYLWHPENTLPVPYLTDLFSKCFTFPELFSPEKGLCLVSREWNYFITTRAIPVALEQLGLKMNPKVIPIQFVKQNNLAVRWIQNPNFDHITPELMEQLTSLAKTNPEAFNEDHIKLISYKAGWTHVIPDLKSWTLHFQELVLILLPIHNHHLLFENCIEGFTQFRNLYELKLQDFRDPGDRVERFYRILSLVPYLFEYSVGRLETNDPNYIGLGRYFIAMRTLPFRILQPTHKLQYRESEIYLTYAQISEAHTAHWNDALQRIIKHPRGRQFAAENDLIPN